jgi:hypothetical protein
MGRAGRIAVMRDLRLSLMPLPVEATGGARQQRTAVKGAVKPAVS